MELNDNQIKELLNWFVKTSETRKKWHNERVEEQVKANQWIQPELIQKMSDEELKKRYLEYFGNGTGKKQNIIQIPKNKIIKNPKFRETLLYLLDEKIDVKKRINNVLSGEKHVDGMGKALTTAFLMDFKLDKYCLWNGKTDAGIWALGMQKILKRKKGETEGDIYLRVLDLFKKLKNKYNLSYLDIDLFLHTIAAEEEGKKELKKIKYKGLTIIEDPDEIKIAQELFENRFKELVDEIKFEELKQDKIMFSKLGIWASFRDPNFFYKKNPNIFYNPFGVGKPAGTAINDATLELNFSLTNNKLISGVFAKDSSNNIYVLHRGRLGGKFVGKQLLEENYNGEWVEVQDGDKKSNLILIGELNEPDFPEKVRNFVFEVDRIKNGSEVTKLSFIGFLNKNGYYFEPELIENFLLSLKVKPFVILTGNSGTGKTKIAQMFAKYINIKNPVQEANRYEIVPVGANWTENRHIIGFYNVITDEYQRTPALDIIIESNNNGNSHEPFFLILDEMNLSHVERYFSDFLSTIESKEPIPLHLNDELKGVPTEIGFSDNLFVIGTVNVDETTYMFSPKVLDRSNTIEFLTPSAKGYMNGDNISGSINGDIDYLENPLSNIEIRSASLSELKKLFGELNTPEGKFWDLMAVELEEFQNVLKSIGFDFGFRVINEIMRFMYVSWVYEGKSDTWDNWQRYFDAQVKQKMLPRIHGSQRTLENALDELSNLCENYPTSKDKLEEMNNVLKKQRYVSFTN